MLNITRKRQIRNIFANLLGFALIVTGIVQKSKKDIFAKGDVTAMYFHNPNKVLFEKSIKWLIKNGYTFISAKELIAILDGKMLAVKGSVWISFDDGWKDNLDNVIPILTKYKVPATFFISTDPVISSGVFWWTYAQKYEKYLPRPINKNIDLLWKMKEEDRKKVINYLVRKFPDKLERQAMTVDEVTKISSNPFVEIGSHTVNHVITPNCNKSDLEFEISQSKKDIEKFTKMPVTLFSYPNGDYDGGESFLLRKHGYQLAATTVPKQITAEETDSFLVPRFSAGSDNAPFLEVICRLVGIWAPFLEKIENRFNTVSDK